jgi:hypothetical protein
MMVQPSRMTTTASTLTQPAASMEGATAAAAKATASSSLRLPLTAAYSKANEQGAAAATNIPKEQDINDVSKNAAAAAAATASTTTVWEYPVGVPLPNKALLKSLYQTAMKHNRNDDNDGNGNDSNDDTTTPRSTKNDQQQISDLGLLSMEDVLLPAIAYKEEQALKKIQAVVQRDYPNNNSNNNGGNDYVQELVLARKAVYDATRAAIQACEANRLQRRLPQQAAREATWQQERLATLQRAQQEAALQQHAAAQLQAQARERRRQERRDKHPVNQELWREVAYLMTEMHHLEKEERLWKDAAASLLLQQQEQEQEQQQVAAEQPLATGKEHANDDDAMDVDDNSDKAASTTTPTIQTVLDAIDSITLSSVRVEQSLQMVADMMQQSDALRSEIYRRHEAERFRGYPGEREPKDLIRLLSQD